MRFNRRTAFFLFVAFSMFCGLPRASSQDNVPLDSVVLRQAYSASIRVYGIDSVTQRQNSSQFSAVVVSEDGYILTVAHATKPGHLYKVGFPDGKEGVAMALGRLLTDPSTTRPDVALMKMEGQGPWPYAEMGWTSSLEEGQFCFGISYPESLRLDKPFIRFGKIVSTLDEWGFLESTCIMETGDSGGPLFDALGRVVALHSRIDQPESISYEVPVDIYRQYWSALLQPKTYDSLPTLKDQIGVDVQKEYLMEVNWKVKNYSFDMQRKSDAVVKIQSESEGKLQSILGTLFDISGLGQIVVSKSSAVGESAQIEVGDRIIQLSTLFRDEKNDLVALKPSQTLSEQRGLNITTLKDRKYVIGTLLSTTLVDTISKEGVLGMERVHLPLRFSSGSFGASLQAKEGVPTVVRIDEGGPAESAGMEIGDQVIQISNTLISSAQDFNQEMGTYLPGHEVVFGLKRGGEVLTRTVKLVARIHREQPHPMNRFEGGKSSRRDGFDEVFIHDSKIHAHECGSPIFDKQGRLVGLNIARFSHTACVAVPIHILLDFFDELRQVTLHM